jgi:hypothetical protein
VYNIYVGASVQGVCGPTTNSGGFLGFSFDAAFPNMRFRPPGQESVGTGFGEMFRVGEMEVGLPGLGIFGEGTVSSYTFCPMYEDGPIPCSVTQGPHPFEPSLSMLLPGEEPGDIPLVPLVGTPPAVGESTLSLLFSIGGTAEQDPFLEWECGIGTGALGGAVQPGGATFPVPWARIMAGEDIEVNVTTGDEGETWSWTMRMFPARP